MEKKLYNLLLIEDDKIDQLAFKRAMKEHKDTFKWEIADNFLGGCRLIEENNFDLIISDFNLGDGTGLDIVKKYNHIPIIVVTASDDVEAAVNSLMNGARDYIVKDRASKYLEVLPLTAKKTLDQYNAELKARDTEERFRELFENSSDLIQSVAVDGRFNYVNPEWKSVFGYNDNEIKKIRLLDIIWPDDRDEWAARLRDIFAGKNFKTLEARFLSKQNEIIYAEGEVRCRYINNVPVAAQAIFKNVTSRKLADEQLKNSERQYRMLVENASDLIFKLDKDLNITYANSVSEKETGYFFEQLLGKSIIDLVVMDQQVEVRENLMSTFASENNTGGLEYQITTKKGLKIWIGQKATIVNDPSRQVTELLVIARNITHSKRKEIELRLTNAELERIVENRTTELKKTNDELLDTKDELNLFLYKSSHNLMGPSSRLQGLINLQKNVDTALPSEQFLSMFEQNTAEIRKIIEKLSWVSVFNEQVGHEEIDVRELIESCISEVVSEERKQGIKIENETPENCTVFSDPALFRLIITNLIDNAVVYRRHDSRQHFVSISVSQTSAYFMLEVRDSGTGISSEIMDKVFNMFYRGSEMSKGNGLGLYLVKKAVKALNGKVELKSEENKFTSVTVRLDTTLQ